MAPSPPQELLRVDGLTAGYRVGARYVSVVRRLNLSIHPGEVVGLLGESGCGKLGRKIFQSGPSCIRSGREFAADAAIVGAML